MSFQLPPDIEARYAGRWIAWDLDTNQLLGDGARMRDVDELSRAALKAGHVIHTTYIWPLDVTDRQKHWETLPESKDPTWDVTIPREVELQYVGQVIAWDLVDKRVVGHGDTIDDASDAARAAKQTGHPLYYHYVFPPNAVLLGGFDLAFFDHADGRSETPDHSGTDRSAERNIDPR
jgi:hypothetical protein